MKDQDVIFILADAGATKTKWQVRGLSANADLGLLRPTSQIKAECRTTGINPNLQTEAEIATVVKTAFDQLLKGQPAQNYQLAYFGAGLGNISNQLLMKRIIQACWSVKDSKLQQITLMTDLHAVGWGGMTEQAHPDELMAVGILGTGSNIGIYGPTAGFGQIVKTRPSLGCWLGDFGSGADIGKRILTAWVREMLDTELVDALDNLHGGASGFLKACYQSHQPAAKLGQLVKDLELFSSHDELKTIRQESFRAFLQEEVLPLLQGHEIKTVKLSGGIANQFNDELKQLFETEAGLSIHTVAEPF